MPTCLDEMLSQTSVLPLVCKLIKAWDNQTKACMQTCLDELL